MTAVICFLLGTLLLVAFAFYNPNQTSYFTTSRSPEVGPNPVGTFGATAGLFTFWVFGLSGWLLPFSLLWFCYLAMRRARRIAR